MYARLFVQLTRSLLLLGTRSPSYSTKKHGFGPGPRPEPKRKSFLSTLFRCSAVVACPKQGGMKVLDFILAWTRMCDQCGGQVGVEKRGRQRDRGRDCAQLDDSLPLLLSFVHRCILLSRLVCAACTTPSLYSNVNEWMNGRVTEQ